jgi:LPS-assembly protein
MKNKISYIFLLLSFFILNTVTAEELSINSSKVKYDKESKITYFSGDVNAEDENNNKIFTDYAKYNKAEGILETEGKTKILTSEGYTVEGENIVFNNNKKIISSNYDTQITDKDGNEITVEMFNYFIEKNIFFSKGAIQVSDINNNNYNFSEIYIDEINKKMVGSDVKAFLNSKDILIDEANQPRFFANTVSVSGGISSFNKGVFTYCKNRENEKCPPWELQSEKIEHNLATKTIYYKNAFLKVYDFPIFYFPRFSHPDPTVKRRSGFLIPSLSNSSTVGSGFNLPYFLSISGDKDVTITPKIYLSENPVILAEYRQDFKDSYVIIDTSISQGYKNTTAKKTGGSRSHFFSKFNKILIDEKDKASNFAVNLQTTSNDTYFKIHDINTKLVSSEISVLESTVDYTYQDRDLFFGSNVSVYEDTNKLDRTRWEYSLPVTFEKNILTDEQYGSLNFASNIRIRNYDVNTRTDLLINDFNWKSKKWISDLGFENNLISNIKVVNYKADNTMEYKTEKTNSELSGAIGYFSKLGLYKKDLIKGTIQSLTPKALVRYAPGHMRPIKKGSLTFGNLFNLSKIKTIDVIEPGLSTSVGFDFKLNNFNADTGIGKEKFSFSAGQVISEKENKDIPSKSSLDQRFSDIVGKSELNFNQEISFRYDFKLDQNYKELNYNEIGTDLNYGKTKFNISYLEEKNHIGNQEYVKSGVDLELKNNTALSFSAKRNILTNSAEYYNLNYEYFNDCLRAGIAYRRSFYTDRDIESANSLMFKITFIPFGQINSPEFPNSK